MPNRTPNFVVVGVGIVMFLLGFFYISCSTKTTELRETLEEFEERIRLLTIKNDDNERKIETINLRKHELEEENALIHKQLNKRTLEISDLKFQLNEKIAEFQSLESDKQVLDQQLKEFKNISNILSLKNSAIEKLQQQFDEQKQSDNEQLDKLKQNIEHYENRLNNLTNKENKSLDISNSRFKPLLSSNETSPNSSLLLPKSLGKLGDISNKIKDNVNESDSINIQKPYPVDMLIENNSTNSNYSIKHNSSNIHRRVQRLSKNSLSRNKLSNNIDDNNNIKNDDEDAEKKMVGRSKSLLNETNIVKNQSQLSIDDKHYRIANREDFNQIEDDNN